MPTVIYKDDRTPEQRIQDRLKPSSPTGGQVSKETNPTRTITTSFYGGSQHCEQKGDANG